MNFQSRSYTSASDTQDSRVNTWGPYCSTATDTTHSVHGKQVSSSSCQKNFCLQPGRTAPRQLPVSHYPSVALGHMLSHRLAAAWKTKQKIAASGEGSSLGRCLVRNSRD